MFEKLTEGKREEERERYNLSEKQMNFPNFLEDTRDKAEVIKYKLRKIST